MVSFHSQSVSYHTKYYGPRVSSIAKMPAPQIRLKQRPQKSTVFCFFLETRQIHRQPRTDSGKADSLTGKDGINNVNYYCLRLALPWLPVSRDCDRISIRTIRLPASKTDDPYCTETPPAPGTSRCCKFVLSIKPY